MKTVLLTKAKNLSKGLKKAAIQGNSGIKLHSKVLTPRVNMSSDGNHHYGVEFVLQYPESKHLIIYFTFWINTKGEGIGEVHFDSLVRQNRKEYIDFSQGSYMTGASSPKEILGLFEYIFKLGELFNTQILYTEVECQKRARIYQKACVRLGGTVAIQDSYIVFRR